MSADARIRFLRSDDRPLVALAEWVINDEHDLLPDLTGVSLIVPESSYAAPLRRLLLDLAAKVGTTALLPPFIGTLDQWLSRFGTGPDPSGVRRALILLDLIAPLLAKHLPFLAPNQQLIVATELLAIFDQWERGNRPGSWSGLSTSVARAYGAKDDFTPITDETRLVYEAWEPWRAHLQSAPGDSDRRNYRRKLTRAASAETDMRLYLCGMQDWDPDEERWLERLMIDRRATLLLHAPRPYLHRVPAFVDRHATVATNLDAGDIVIEETFRDAPLAERVRRACVSRAASPLLDRIRWYEAAGFEDEAQTVAGQIQRLLADGIHQIGVVTTDRKLARRIRALLDRVGLQPADSAGWRLSTTSAAHALKVWWDAAKQGFDDTSLANLLRSPFLARDVGPDPQLTTPIGLEERRRQTRSAGRALGVLMDHQRHPLSLFLETLLAGLEQSGIGLALDQDDAGRLVLNQLGQLAAATRGRRLELNADECFAWLTDRLDERHFALPGDETPVRLLGLSESRLYGFDAVILAGADDEHLPGHAARPLFFNDAVRHDLGLSVADDTADVLFRDFLKLLRGAPRVVLGWRRQDGADTRLPSPWIERLRFFHRQAYGCDLTKIPDSDRSESPTQAGLPTPRHRPRPTVPPTRIPRQISARAHQRLIDCPYQYFAAEILNLKRRPDPDEDRSRADYGERVHRILEAFHRGVAGLPGPLSGPLTAVTRADGEALLIAISVAVFRPDEDFGNRLALGQWLRSVPAYLAWEIAHSRQFKPRNIEERFRRLLTPEGPELMGRIDRIDDDQGRLALIDYKTGQLPELKEIVCGESVQLPFYASLIDEPIQIACLVRVKEQVDVVCLGAAELAELVPKTDERLQHIHATIVGGAALPANGRPGTCRFCDYEGLCRQSFCTDDDPVAP